jgi:uncharacterized SAM-binding protein YcdF (DUF218 family)
VQHYSELVGPMSARTIRTWGLIVAVVVVAFAGATARLFVWPSTSTPRQADAIVVFGARNSERLPEAVRLADKGFAPVLVIMTPPEDRSICGGRPTFEVICKEPNPFSTRGEAQAVGELAAKRDWDSLLLVTSSYHLTRARLLLERCFGGNVRGIATTPAGGIMRRAERISHEWGGLLDAEMVARSC